MSVLKNRKFAWCVLVAVVILFTFFGIRRSLSKLSAETENMFYNGVYLEKEGYTSASIETHLQKRIEASLGMITVASNYDGLKSLTDDLRAAREELMDADTISEKYDANVKLEAALNAVTKKLDSVGVSPSDLDDYSDYSSTLSGAQYAINSNACNSKVDEYYKNVLGTFPSVLFKGLMPKPEYFA